MAFKRRETDKKSVQIKHEHAKQSIKKFRKDMKKKLKELEVSAVAILDLQCEMFVKKLDKEMGSLSHFVQRLDDNIGHLKISSESNNASQLFVALKIVNKDISETKSVYKTMSTQVVKCIEFRPDAALARSKCLKNLGKIDFNVIEKPTPLWEVKSAEDILLRTKEDTKDPCIKSACITSVGHILLVDSNNSNIKLFDRGANNVIDTYALETAAWSVCRFEENKSIVSQPSDQRVMIVEADRQIKPTGFIYIGYDCFAIAYSQQELYISDEFGSVIVYSMSGDILRQYSQDQNGKYLFSDIWALAVNKAGDRIYAADKDKGVIALNKDGTLLWAFTDTTYSDANGICLDEIFHNVFALVYTSDNVMQIEQTGKKLGQVLKQMNGLNYPTTMCYEWQSDTLIIANNFGSNLRNFQLR